MKKEYKNDIIRHKVEVLYMKVILLDNVKGVGKKDEVINASDGYARNFLFPKKLAVEANNENMSKLKQKKQSEQYKKDVEKEQAQKIALEMVNKEIEKYGEEYIIMMIPKPGKNTWTAKEIKESIINDTIPDGCTTNFIDDILKYQSYYK